MTNYYKVQLSKIDTKSTNSPALKIEDRGMGKHTNWLDINPESAAEIIEWLQTNFILNQAKK